MQRSSNHTRVRIARRRWVGRIEHNVLSLSLLITALMPAAWCASPALSNDHSRETPSAPQQTSSPPQHPKTPPANPSDVASIDSIVAALYDVISGPAGKGRDWDRMRSLFLPGARLIPTGKRATGETVARTVDVEGYIAGSSPYMDKEGFFEREVSRRTERFNSIAHVFSTYESRHKADDAQPFDRGINSIQLFNDGKRWWIVTVFWEAERPDNKIPEQYLQRNKD